jgi:hypothetical protein
MLPDDPRFLSFWDKIKLARKEQAASFGYFQNPDFLRASIKERLQFLKERYVADLKGFGFNIDSNQTAGLVFRKPISDGQWDFLFVDDSRDGVKFGRLQTKFAITLPKRVIRSGPMSMSAAATFFPRDIVPGFEMASTFDKDAYEEFCLAVDANAYLARIFWKRVNHLLSQSKEIYETTKGAGPPT